MPKLMILTPTRAGLVYECASCGATGSATNIWADTHTC